MRKICGLELIGRAIVLIIFSLFLLPPYSLVVSLFYLGYWLVIGLVVFQVK